MIGAPAHVELSLTAAAFVSEVAPGELATRFGSAGGSGGEQKASLRRCI
jgi:hypothetical protein